MGSDSRIAYRCPNPACCATNLATPLQCQKRYEANGIAGTVSFRFAYCRECRLGFVDPQPNAEVLSAFYPRDYAYWVPPATHPSLADRIKYLFAGWRHRNFVKSGLVSRVGGGVARVAEMVAGRDASFSLGIPLALPRTSNILDYGFGSGDFLLALSALGYPNLWGYDLDRNRQNRDHLSSAGIHALCGEERVRLPANHFDCIRLEHVVEHLPAPIDTLGALKEKLRPGGILVLTVPSIHAWEPIESLADSPHIDHLQLPIHLWHHSARSIMDFLAAANLVPLAVRRLRPFQYLSALAQRALTDR